MSQKKIWITRSLPSAHKSAANFEQLGLSTIIAPLLDIARASNQPPLPNKKTLLIFTSVNGLNGFCRLTDLRHWSIVAVGDETALQAKAKGFSDVSSAGGTSEDVTRLVKSDFPTSRPITHCAGKHVRGTIIKDLQAAGFSARRDIYYQSSPVPQLPRLDFAQLDYIALYSPLAAKTLAGFRPDLSGAAVLSMSRAIDAALGGLKCRSRFIAQAPNETAMLALLGPSERV